MDIRIECKGADTLPLDENQQRRRKGRVASRDYEASNA